MRGKPKNPNFFQPQPSTKSTSFLEGALKRAKESGTLIIADR